jgi:hypothetical protein
MAIPIPPGFVETIAYIQVLAEDHDVYYVGSRNTIDEGIRNFYEHLDHRGHILIEEPEIIDYLEYDTIIYIIIYKSLGKLEYLEYLWEKSVDKNVV